MSLRLGVYDYRSHLTMDAENWATAGTFVWLGTYLLFFLGACFLYGREASTVRAAIAIGFSMLVLFNVMILAEYWDITNMQYSPQYEDPSYYGGYYNEVTYPAWQRPYYWGGVAIDIIGKTLAGIGLIIEGRQQITKRRMADYYSNLPTS